MVPRRRKQPNVPAARVRQAFKGTRFKVQLLGTTAALLSSEVGGTGKRDLPARYAIPPLPRPALQDVYEASKGFLIYLFCSILECNNSLNVKARGCKSSTGKSAQKYMSLACN